ncbi:MGMT family protein [Nitrincola tibetensis]|nr:methylated-DNA--[protein]-cysteine S-methyltransferase [Nitrincola tibetensis]
MSSETLKHMIWQVVYSIPEGEVMSYGQIAKLCGYPGYARYVGTVLKQLPEDSQLPWHRVINAQGRLSFPQDSSSFDRQKTLLEAEGWCLDGNKVRRARGASEAV